MPLNGKLQYAGAHVTRLWTNKGLTIANLSWLKRIINYLNVGTVKISSAIRIFYKVYQVLLQPKYILG
jgi:hypothetical protein